MEDKDHKINELGQEKKILDRINTTFSDELEKTKKDIADLKKENIDLKKDLKDSVHKIKEREQEKIFASKNAQDEQEKLLTLKNTQDEQKKSDSPIKYYLTMAGGLIMRFWSFIQQVV